MNIVKADSMTSLLSEAEVREILAAPYLMRLAYQDAEGWPVVQPVWFQFEEEKLLTTVDKGARKAVRLAADERCYFTIDHSGPEGTFGVRGRARARVIEDSALAERIVRASLHKYLGSEDGALAEALLGDARKGEVATLELTPVKYAVWRYEV